MLFDSLSGLNLFTFTLEVDLLVTYQTTFGRKRDVESKTVSLSARAVMDAATSNKARSAKEASAPDVSDSKTTAVGSAVSAGSVLLIVGVVAAAVYRHRALNP